MPPRKKLTCLPEQQSRRWDALQPEILVIIFTKLILHCQLFRVYYVCRSWRSAVFDAVFPSATVLDLRKLEEPYVSSTTKRQYLCFLQMLLDTRPQNQWRRLRTPDKFQLSERAILYIAQRTPCLQYLDVRGIQLAYYVKALPYWKNLIWLTSTFEPQGWLTDTPFHFSARKKTVHSRGICTISRKLASYCKNLTYLGLFGRIGAKEASVVVWNLPRLTTLCFTKSSLTVDAVITFDGHKNLETMDLTHTLFIEAKVISVFVHGRSSDHKCTRCKTMTAIEWKDVHNRLSGGKKYLRCAGKECHECKWAYRPLCCCGRIH